MIHRVKQIFLLSGTNVDNILHVQRNNHSNINVNSYNYDRYKSDQTTIISIIKLINQGLCSDKSELANCLFTVIARISC